MNAAQKSLFATMVAMAWSNPVPVFAYGVASLLIRLIRLCEFLADRKGRTENQRLDGERSW